MIDAIILALFAWTNIKGISQPDTAFSVSISVAGISITGLVVAVVAYFFAPEKLRNKSALAAYVFLIVAVGVLTLQTGSANSPFIALWMLTAIFSGIFGVSIIALLVTALAGYTVWAGVTGQMESNLLVTAVLAGFLPLLISYVLWHGKSSTDKTKERAYYDLANELNQVSNKSDVVISAISDGVIAINNSGQIELINPAAQRIVGWDHQDALGLDYKSVLQLLAADGHELSKSTDPVFEVLTTNQPKRRNDLRLQTSSGKKIEAEVVVSPIGRIGSGAIIVFRDITKERAEERAQAEFISTASHEMRTPVASIEGYLGLALNPATAKIDEKAHEFITKAHEAAEHLGRLFQDLLDVTKADDGRLQNNPKVIDVVTFTSDIVEGLRAKAEEKNLRLFFKPITDGEANGGSRSLDPVYYVDLDADHLREVLSNLVENAIKYTPAGEVMIDVQGNEDHVVVSIKDSGIGIPAEDIPHLFQKFYRVDNTDTREIGGTGLGLYLCRRLVEAMGGRVWVDSEYKKGSTFSIELPRISHAEAQRLIEAASSESIKPSEIMTSVGEGTTEKQNDPKSTLNSAMTESERAEALSTPIIMNRSKPTADAQPTVQPTTQPAAPTTPTPPTAPSAPAPSAAPVPVVEHNSDPLVGDSQTAAAPEPLRPQNPMVLPTAWQNMPSNLQSAAQQQPAPQPPTSVNTRTISVPKR